MTDKLMRAVGATLLRRPFTVLFFTLLVAFVIPRLPYELSRWQLASAQLKARSGDIHGAIQQLDEVIDGRGSDPDLFMERAFLRSRAGDHDGALEDGARAVELSQGKAEMLRQYGLLLQLAGRHDEAIEY